MSCFFNRCCGSLSLQFLERVKMGAYLSIWEDDTYEHWDVIPAVTYSYALLKKNVEIEKGQNKPPVWEWGIYNGFYPIYPITPCSSLDYTNQLNTLWANHISMLQQRINNEDTDGGRLQFTLKSGYNFDDLLKLVSRAKIVY